MGVDYSVTVIRRLEDAIRKAGLHRPMAVSHYEAGTELEYRVTGVEDGREGAVKVRIDKFVGGGFAGQVYRVDVLDIDSKDGHIDGLRTGRKLAMKILIPPSSFSRIFRNLMYWIGFQGAFQLQVNPAAMRAGALWQKLIQRGAKARFGDASHVRDIYATFVDETMGSCGELSDWIEGRTWRLEVDPHLDMLKRWRRRKKIDPARLGSPEYRSKYHFMHDFVDLLHNMGAHEFARQYEWSTCKSQPNTLKYSSTENRPDKGLVAVDFRAGLALLPFLPMSPGDFKLIGAGILRGSLVQFDRGDLRKLERFIAAHPAEFAGAERMLWELQDCEREYRDSVPDFTHNFFRFLYDRGLWSTLLRNTVRGWRIRNLIDDRVQARLQRNVFGIGLFNLLGFIPLAGKLSRRLWGQAYWRKHYGAILTNPDYFRRALRAKLLERLVDWHRDGRITEKRTEKLMRHLWPCAVHLPLSILPAGLHHFLTDWSYFRERLDYILLRPVRLYFNADLRAQWLHDMVEEGKSKHILTDEEAGIILRDVQEPFIQKYLKSLAVHICTLPVTQVISVMIAAIYVATHPEMPRAQAYGIGLSIIALFQVVPISPGSLVRGLYVLYLVIREKNFKDYNIAVFLGFFKYIGYLAFPIQMTYRYPALARFMAGHWATDAVHIVPVFGERGALLEHFTFNLFYNWPLTIRRRMEERREMRKALKPRFAHAPLIALFGTGLFWAANRFVYHRFEELPGLKTTWIAAILIPALCGMLVTRFAGGAALWKRVAGGALCGMAIAVLHVFLFMALGWTGGAAAGDLFVNGFWKVFVYTLMSTLGVLITELSLPGRKLA